MKQYLLLMILGISLIACEKEFQDSETKLNNFNSELQSIETRSDSLNCESCDAFSVTSQTSVQGDSCCVVSLNLQVDCDSLERSLHLSLFVNGSFYQNINLTNSVSIPIQVCDSTTIEIYDGRTLCHSEVLKCEDCCSSLSYTQESFYDEKEDCCVFIFELLGDSTCINEYDIEFSSNGVINEDDVIYFAGGLRKVAVAICDNSQYVIFSVVDSVTGEVCLETNPLQHCQS